MMTRLIFLLLFSTAIYGQDRRISTIHITQANHPIDERIEVLGKLAFDDTKYSTVEIVNSTLGLHLQISGQPLMGFSTNEMSEEVRAAFIEELRKNKNQPEKNRFKLDKSGNLIDLNNGNKIVSRANPRTLAALREDYLKKYWFPVDFNLLPGQTAANDDDFFNATPSTINGIPISEAEAKKVGKIFMNGGSQRLNAPKFAPHLEMPNKNLIEVFEH